MGGECYGRSTEGCYCLPAEEAIAMSKEARAWRSHREEVQQQSALPATYLGSCILNVGLLLWAAWRWMK